MIDLALLIAPTFVWVVFAKAYFKHDFTFGEMALQFAIVVAISTAGYAIAYNGQFSDYRVVHGVVTEKDAVRKSCDTSWSDFSDSFCTNQDTRTVVDRCKTVDGKKSCTYKTQYRSIYSWERRYFVETSIGEYEISREDRQGVVFPQRWEVVSLGEPVSALKEYTNYIQASLNTEANAAYADGVVSFDPVVYDYWNLDQVTWKGQEERARVWSRSLAVLNADLIKYDANVEIHLVDGPQSWAKKFASANRGHDLNDIVVVIGVGPDDSIEWVEVDSWSTSDLVNIEIRDLVADLKIVDEDAISSLLRQSVSLYYVQRSMEEFEYLKDDVDIPLVVLILLSVLVFTLNIGTTIYFVKEEVI